MNVLERLRAIFGVDVPEGADRPPSQRPCGRRPTPSSATTRPTAAWPWPRRSGRIPASWPRQLAGAVDLAPHGRPARSRRPGFLNVRLDDPGSPRASANCSATRVSGLTPPDAAQDGRDRLLVAQRRQADARGPHSLDGDRRQPGADLRGPRTPGHPRQSPGRLGLAVRHDPLGLEERPRRGGLRRRSRGRAGAALSPGPGSDQGRRIGRRGGRAGRDGQAPCRRPGEPGALGPVHAPLPRALQDDLRPAGRAVRRRSSARASTTRCSPRSSRTSRRRDSPSRAKGRSSSSSTETEAPFIVRKSDGAYNYATTDLATIQYRVATWHPDQFLYVVDHRQGDHFKQLFAVARQVGLRLGRPRARRLRHDPGRGPPAVQDPRGRRRRPGIAARRGRRRGAQGRRREQPRPRRRPSSSRVAEVVGLGAIKYADLSQNRLSDYVFDWQKMLAMNGNTATYLQYAYARIQSIFRKGGLRTRGDPQATAGDRPEPSRRTRPGRAAPPPARSPRTGRRRAEAEHPDRLSVRPGQRVQHVLRGVPGAQGRVARAPRQPAGTRAT